MRILTLDLSREATGWACWAPGDARPASGWRQLGSDFTARGMVFAKLHELMSEVSQVCGPIEALFIEDALTPEKLHGFTNIDTTKLQLGLAAHALSWAEAMGVRIVREVNMKTWRRDFLGKLSPKSKSTDLKAMAVARCIELGFGRLRHDEAEAVGLLDHACLYLRVSPPWQAQLGLRAQGRVR